DITMGAGAATSSNNANLLLNAGQDATLQSLSAGSGKVAVIAETGGIANGGSAAANISASGLILTAGGSIGSASDALKTSVSTLSAQAAGSIYLTETDAVTVDTVSVAVQRVDLLGHSSAFPVPAKTQSDITTTAGNGSIVLLAGGSVTLNEGVSHPGVAVSPTGSGSIRISALGTGSNLLNNAKVQSATGDVTLKAGATLTPGVVQTAAKVLTDGAAFVLTTDIDGRGQAITVVADQVDIRATLTSVGANLSFAPLPAATPVPIVIGGPATAPALQLSLNELALLQPGFAQISLGNGQANQSLTILGQDSTGAAKAAVFKDPLSLNLIGVNSTLAVSGQLQGQSLSIDGSPGTATSTLTAADISMVGNVTLNGVVQVASGQSTITAGSNAADAVTGSLRINGPIVGSAAGGELLSLVSESDVVIGASISGIDGLSVRAAGNVSFADTLAVSGDVVIEASGIVSFAKNLKITNGGTLTIRGATSVVFGSGVLTAVDGNITIDAKSLALLGGADSLSSSGGVLTLTSANSGHAIVVGADVSQPATANALNLTSREIAAIGSGFSRVVLGQADTGAITLATNADLTSVGTSTVLELRAASVTAAGGTVQMSAALLIDTHDSIMLNASLSMTTAASITLTSSGGSIAMAAGTRLSSSGGDVQLKVSDGHSIFLGVLDTRAAGAVQGSGIVTIESGSGTITDVNNDDAVNVYAKAVNFFGYGPDSAAAGNVIEVQAEVVRVSAPQGTVLRHSDLNGYAHFELINAGRLYEQMVVMNAVTRVTENPATLLLKDDAALIAAGLPLSSALLSSPKSVSLQPLADLIGYVTPLQEVGNLKVLHYLAASDTGALTGQPSSLMGSMDNGGTTASSDILLSDASYGIADRLQQSYVLGTPGEQPLISGLSGFSLGNYDYSVDTLAL
ncbi:MAG: hypothetical protein NTZ64_11760, partial [Polaromonas sp.]|nr:hypothetical protein [Polaromonas sp.]